MRRAWLLFFIGITCVLQAQKNISYRSNLKYPRILANVWGYTDTATGKEYALVGEETGLSIVDISNPDTIKQLFFVPNDTSMWQEPKTWKSYAYMTNEKGGGLLIVDLSNLPLSVNYVKWKNIPGEDYRTSHTCFVDEKGFLYLSGSNISKKGVLFCDLNPNPMNPLYLGRYDDFYVHDCFARNDTLYTAEILDGQFSVIDVRNKANPVVLTRQTTPFFFSHNVWPDDEAHFLFNTDEKKFAPVTSYNIEDLNDIKELDQFRHSDFDSTIPHNVYYRDGYLYISYYRDGVVIADAHKPDNLVEVGWYDTSPFPPGSGFEGCWGVYNFFPSGNIVCSDRQEGLFVLTPHLKRACYLEGQVTEAGTGNNLNNISVEIMGLERIKNTDLFGRYKTGIGDSGMYDVRFTDRNGYCFTKIVSGVELKEAQTTTLNVELECVPPSGVISLAQGMALQVQPTVFSSETIAQLHTLSGNTVDIYLSDMQGRQLKRWQTQTTYTSLIVGRDLPAGTYLLYATDGVHTQTQQLIKQQ